MSDLIVTLITRKSQHLLTDTITSEMSYVLSQAGGKITKQDWLAEEEACDLFISGLSEQTASTALTSVTLGRPIDWVVQPPEHRKKKLLISDMDSTMITVECIDELADFVGMKAHVAAITERAMNGELDFKEALKERVKLLAGLPESTLDEAYKERVKFTRGAKELVATMRKHDALCVLVSGGFTFFTRRVREGLGFHVDESNQLEIVDGKLTGNVVPPILDKHSKLSSLMYHAEQHGVALADTLAVGDGANDLPMLLSAGLGIAYHAKPSVQEQAHARINHCNLKALLFVQGYHAQEIVQE